MERPFQYINLDYDVLFSLVDQDEKRFLALYIFLENSDGTLGTFC